MTVEKNLIFVSFCGDQGIAATKSCQALLTQLRSLVFDDNRCELWDRSLIPAGSNIEAAISAALARTWVAVVLVSSEYLVSVHWEREAKPLLAAAQAGQIRLLWQQISPCNCDQKEIHQYKQMIPGAILTKCKPAIREEHELKMSNAIFQAWKEFAPCSRSLGALAIDHSGPSASMPAPLHAACDAVALVITPSGGDEEAGPCYQWRAFIQEEGEDRFREIPNGVIGAEPTYTKERLPELLQYLQCWIDNTRNDTPVLDIFACRDLLDEDWGSFPILEGGECRPLDDYQPFLLRSSDRLLNQRWTRRRGALKRMHQHLVEGTGAWLPLDKLAKADSLERLDGKTQHPEAGHAVVSAIYSQQSNIFRSRPGWLRSVLMSMAPLVIWPSQRGALAEEQLQHLPLLRTDVGLPEKPARPHCPDLAHLAMARHQRGHPEIDLRGLTILVDHPDRAPDRTTLQSLFPAFSEDPSTLSESVPASDSAPATPTTQFLIST